MAHTEGPWAYDDDTHNIVSTTIFEEWSTDLEDEDPVPKRVLCVYGAMGGEDNRADLALFVASAELLSMVKRFVDASGSEPASDEEAKLIEEAKELIGRAQDPLKMRKV